MIVQLADGLGLCGVLNAIKLHPKLMKPLFCLTGRTEIDDESFMEKIKVEFNNSQQKKLCEEDTFKHFSDFTSLLYHEGEIQYVYLGNTVSVVI